ncbi:MAG: terminase small subunit [Burkholderiaceae bacterium]|nr:terminase small subunit [Burkholderiaceae bacterium]
MTIDLNQPMTQADFGALVGVSRQAIGALVARGVLDMDASAQQVLHAYCSHMREHAAGRASGGDLDLVAERAGLAKEQKDRLAMVNAVTRKELAPVALIEEVLSKAGARIAGMFDAIPGAVRRRVPSLSSDEVNNISKEIARIRNIAASMSLADLREASEDGEQDDNYLEDDQP